MVEGVSRRGWRGQGGGRPLRVLAVVALLALAGCSAAASEDAGGSNGGVAFPPGGFRDDDDGGQTGSLTPRCGLPPLAQAQGVSATTGIVFYTTDCPDLPGELGLFDANGNPVPFQTQPIGSGVVLVTPAAGLTPGSYTLGNVSVPVEDDDAGLDEDAGIASGAAASPDAGTPPVQGETITVRESSAAPRSLGELRQPRGLCSNVLELVLDPRVTPFLSALALDLHVGPLPPLRVADFGTVVVSPAGVVHIAIPIALLRGNGPFHVAVAAAVAGDALSIAPASLDIACQAPAVPVQTVAAQDEDEGGCSVRGAGARSSPSTFALLAALLVIGLHRRTRRRRRRRRPPD